MLIVLAFPVLIYLLILAGLSINVSALIALVALCALDWKFNFSAVMALMTPVILIGGMTMGWFTPTEAAVAAVIWSLFLGLVRYRSMTFKSLAKAELRHHRDHRLGALHRHRRLGLRLAPDRQPGGAADVGRHPRASPTTSGCSCCW